jgi:hypothetical protein
MAAKSKPIRRCQHIKVNGEQCGSPALKRNRLCFFHNRWRVERLDFRANQPFQEVASMDFPVLEDANSIQVALMQIMRLLLARQLDAKLGGLLLYALQTASANLRHANFSPEPEKVVIDPRKVRSVGLRQNAWTPPPQPVQELSKEEREKLAEVAMNRAFSGQGDTVRELLLWSSLVGDVAPESKALEASAISPPTEKTELAPAGSP